MVQAVGEGRQKEEQVGRHGAACAEVRSEPKNGVVVRIRIAILYRIE
jgi:hypothetical protein